MTAEATASVRLQPAVERDRTADERDRIADERERIADERDRLADQREDLADQRDELADERDRTGTLAPDRSAVGAFRGSRLRLLESEQALDRARGAMARSESMLARQRLSLQTEDNTGEQQQLEVSREMLASGRAVKPPKDDSPE